MPDTAPVRGFIDFVVGSLLAHPGDAHVGEVNSDQNTRYQLSVHADDLAYLDADEGRVGQAITTMVDACAYKHHVRAELIIGSDFAAVEEAPAPAAAADEGDDDLDDDEDDDEEVGYDDEDDD